jgi:intergrase/recombinase
MAQRLKIEYKVRKFENGKEVERKYIRKYNDAFPFVEKLTKK